MLQSAAESSVNYDVPAWAVSQLGKQVRLLQDHDDCEDPQYGDMFMHRRGEIGVLDAITSTESGPVAIVLFQDDDTCCVYVPFSKLQRPADFFLSIPGRAGELALLWKSGEDIRKHVSRGTYYKFRKELLSHGIDISMPYRLEALPLP